MLAENEMKRMTNQTGLKFVIYDLYRLGAVRVSQTIDSIPCHYGKTLIVSTIHNPFFYEIRLTILCLNSFHLIFSHSPFLEMYKTFNLFFFTLSTQMFLFISTTNKNEIFYIFTKFITTLKHLISILHLFGHHLRPSAFVG